MESAVGGADDLDEGIQELFYELLGAAEDVDAITQIASISMVPDCTTGSSDICLLTQHVNLMLDKDHFDSGRVCWKHRRLR